MAGSAHESSARIRQRNVGLLLAPLDRYLAVAEINQHIAGLQTTYNKTDLLRGVTLHVLCS
jgi:hypothetical protein